MEFGTLENNLKAHREAMQELIAFADQELASVENALDGQSVDLSVVAVH
jgi:hypothetical protein